MGRSLQSAKAGFWRVLEILEAPEVVKSGPVFLERERLRGERQLQELSEHQARSRWDVWPQFWQTFAARVGARVKLVSLREPFSPP